jgi:hypothetical protein
MEEDATIRNAEFMGPLIGRTIIDVTQHDAEEFAETHESYFMLMFDDGSALKCVVGDAGFTLLNVDDGSPEEA